LTDQFWTTTGAGSPQHGVMSTDAYRLTPEATARATAAGLVDAHWYRTPVPHDVMRQLTRRRNARVTVDAAVWISLIVLSGVVAASVLGSWWAVPAFATYGMLYGGASDARWHEHGHGTALQSRQANLALYHIASFMLLREPTMSRWTHVRHHSDTIVVGRDPEIILRRPPNLAVWALNLVNLVNGPHSLARICAHATGWLSDEEISIVPTTERRRVIIEARIYLTILAAVVATCLATRSITAALLVGLPSFYGAWLVHLLNITQHAGLPENALDHRQVARTMLLNPIGRFLYLNMNYHIEHHMYPAVPYHQLPRLHNAIKHDLPAPNTSLLDAYREIIPALVRQRRDPAYQIHRPIPNSIAPPTARPPATNIIHSAALAAEREVANRDGVRICAVDDVEINDVVRFDHDNRTFAIYRLGTHTWYATDGICTHSRTVHLATGTVVGDRIECPKHNGQFHIPTGQPAQAPACKALNTHQVVERDGAIHLIPTTPATLTDPYPNNTNSSAEARPVNENDPKQLPGKEPTPRARGWV
jgi:Na+-transporting NADH:ubiquinone oxidoreductase subunit F